MSLFDPDPHRVDLQRLLHFPLPAIRRSYQARDTILYALGVGAAQGPEAWDERHLRFVYEKDLQALPTMAAMLGDPGFWMQAPETGLDWKRLLHGEQSMAWLGPLPPEGDVTGHNRVLHVEDKGPGRGVIFVVERELRAVDTEDVLVRSHMTVMARGNQGLPGDLWQQPGAQMPQPLAPLPQRAADRVLDRATTTNQSLLYRLSVDPNPLHADPAVARKAGFERPIMHGMATFGLLGMILVCEFCEFDTARLAEMRARFTAPLYPGETLRCEFWQEDGLIRFRASVAERNAIVLDRGLARVRTPRH